MEKKMFQTTNQLLVNISNIIYIWMPTPILAGKPQFFAG